MKKIGLMGGTFDPIHPAHIEIAKHARIQYKLDEVIFMTSGNPPHKDGSKVTDSLLRHEMVKRAITGIDGFSASDYELKKKEYSYSADTLKWMKEKYKNSEIYFLIGEDSLEYLDKWYHPERILKQCILLIYPRRSMKTLKKTMEEKMRLLGGDMRIIDAPVYAVSSTALREAISRGDDTDGMLNESVMEFIKENKLYGSEAVEGKVKKASVKKTL